MIMPRLRCWTGEPPLTHIPTTIGFSSHNDRLGGAERTSINTNKDIATPGNASQLSATGSSTRYERSSSRLDATRVTVLMVSRKWQRNAPHDSRRDLRGESTTGSTLSASLQFSFLFPVRKITGLLSPRARRREI